MCLHSSLLEESTCSFCQGLPDITKSPEYIALQGRLEQEHQNLRKCLDEFERYSNCNPNSRIVKSLEKKLSRIESNIDALSIVEDPVTERHVPDIEEDEFIYEETLA